MTPWLGLGVALAGGVGAVLRLVVDGAIRTRWASRFPWATVVINVSGSFVLGCLDGFHLSGHLTSTSTTLLGTGICGGFTTFSTATFETVRLAQQGRWRAASINAIFTLLLSVAAATLGLRIGS